jgi:RNA polymerase sigma factor (sigma-70 family)
VQAALAGDKDAFAELIARHWSTAFALTGRLLGSAGLAADAVQEASIGALTGLDRLRAPDRFGAWFCGIALNVARRWLRQLRAELPATLPDRQSTDPGPDEHAELAELAAAVRGAVAQLAAGQRQAVLLFYLQGLTHREVAAELAISVGAVKARLHQARAALMPSLAQLADTGPVGHSGAPVRTAPRPAASKDRLPVAPKEKLMTTIASSQDWIDVTVTEVRRGDGATVGETQPVHVMVLAERGGDRRLPVWVGPAEATCLAISLEAQETPRPLTYQMAGRLLEATDSRVTEVRITRLAGSVFYAVIAVDGPAGSREIDARPSDAVNLAVVAGAPVRVSSELFELSSPRTPGHADWQDFPASTAELAAEAIRASLAHFTDPAAPPEQVKTAE